MINEEKLLLEKVIWTQDDYELMGWHDCRIYGLIFQNVNDSWTTNIVFDIDYIFKWVRPIHPKQSFSFWVAPCTLMFKEAFDLTINVNQKGGRTEPPEIDDLVLKGKVEQETNRWVYEWDIHLQEGYIHFKSLGFDQVVRRRPILTDNQVLTVDERNGISFSLTPCSL